jgi:hypothetical protein
MNVSRNNIKQTKKARFENNDKKILEAIDADQKKKKLFSAFFFSFFESKTDGLHSTGNLE